VSKNEKNSENTIFLQALLINKAYRWSSKLIQVTERLKQAAVVSLIDGSHLRKSCLNDINSFVVAESLKK